MNLRTAGNLTSAVGSRDERKRLLPKTNEGQS